MKTLKWARFVLLHICSNLHHKSYALTASVNCVPSKPLAYWNWSEFSYWAHAGAEWLPSDGSPHAHLVHVQRHLTALLYNNRCILSRHIFFEIGKDLWSRNAAESFRCLVSHHVRFLGILENLEQGGNSMWREELAKDKSDLMPLRPC